jgi:hypothetical protein
MEYKLDQVLSIGQYINSLDEKNLECLKQQMEKESHTNLKYKFNDEYVMIYNNNNYENLSDLEKQCRNLILTSDLQMLCYHFDEIVYNPSDLSPYDLKNAIISESIEGTVLMCFFHNDKWNIATRKCLDASSSKWIKNMSYNDLMLDVITQNVPNESEKKQVVETFFNTLDKNNYYLFTLVHPSNKNIISYQNHPLIGSRQKCLIHMLTRVKGTSSEVLNENTLYNFNNGYMDVVYKQPVFNYNELINVFLWMNTSNNQSNDILYEGLVLRYYENGLCKMIKLQTSKYISIQKMKPNYSNEFQIYLELYKQDNLIEYLNLATSKHISVKKRIVKQLSDVFLYLTKELVLLYHNTRNKQNGEIYNLLPASYKKICYTLHGLYIKNKTKIEYSDVYTLLKREINVLELTRLLLDRKKLIADNTNIYASDNQNIMLITDLLEY